MTPDIDTSDPVGLIIEGARRVVHEMGAERLSIRQVATEAGYAPSAVMYHFGSLKRLLDAVRLDIGLEVSSLLPEGASLADDDDRLHFAKTLLDFVQASPKTAQFVVDHAMGEPPFPLARRPLDSARLMFDIAGRDLEADEFESPTPGTGAMIDVFRTTMRAALSGISAPALADYLAQTVRSIRTLDPKRPVGDDPEPL